MKKPQFIFKFRRPFKGELGDELTGKGKINLELSPVFGYVLTPALIK